MATETEGSAVASKTLKSSGKPIQFALRSTAYFDDLHRYALASEGSVKFNLTHYSNKRGSGASDTLTGAPQLALPGSGEGVRVPFLTVRCGRLGGRDTREVRFYCNGADGAPRFHAISEPGNFFPGTAIPCTRRAGSTAATAACWRRCNHPRQRDCA